MQAKEHIKPDAEEQAGLEARVAFLRLPGSYPYPVGEVEVRETHMSWVFLAGDWAYKLKKPVAYDYLDHRTLLSRQLNSEAEVRLNQVLAGDIYVGVVPLVMTKAGLLALEGRGEPVDWLVKMKRLPESGMLDYAIRRQCLDETALRRVADLLASFYRVATPVTLSLPQFAARLESQIRTCQDQLAGPVFALPAALLRELRAGQLAFLSSRPTQLESRVAAGRILEAHGDLRPEHICLGPRPAIIDRLEFSRELRIMDVAEELAYLDLECELLGNTHVGRVFEECYRAASGDPLPRPLLTFYKVKKACLRAYLVIRHILEPRYQGDPRWHQRALAYLALAEKYHRECSR
ncbi:MAG TPA: hypothetical protein VG870_02290 [Chitinophagaceae bacterium]|nr:hypothetical protein [Chitinophagaceae bacterium]